VLGHLLAKAVGGGTGNATVTLTNSSPNSFDISSPYDNTKAGVIFNSDGTKDEWNDANRAQADSGTDWIIPNIAAGWKTYHVKLDSWTGDALHVSSSAVGSWLPISGVQWFMIETGPGSHGGNGTMRISDDGGTTTLDTATLNISIENV
jgi:hypothetical protein